MKKDSTSSLQTLKSNTFESPMFRNHNNKCSNKVKDLKTNNNNNNNSNLSTGSSNISSNLINLTSSNSKGSNSIKDVVNIPPKIGGITTNLKDLKVNIIAEVNEKSFDDGDVIFNKKNDLKDALCLNKKKIFKIGEKLYYVFKTFSTLFTNISMLSFREITHNWSKNVLNTAQTGGNVTAK